MPTITEGNPKVGILIDLEDENEAGVVSTMSLSSSVSELANDSQSASLGINLLALRALMIDEPCTLKSSSAPLTAVLKDDQHDLKPKTELSIPIIRETTQLQSQFTGELSSAATVNAVEPDTSSPSHLPIADTEEDSPPSSQGAMPRVMAQRPHILIDGIRPLCREGSHAPSAPAAPTIMKENSDGSASLSERVIRQTNHEVFYRYRRPTPQVDKKLMASLVRCKYIPSLTPEPKKGLSIEHQPSKRRNFSLDKRKKPKSKERRDFIPTLALSLERPVDPALPSPPSSPPRSPLAVPDTFPYDHDQAQIKSQANMPAAQQLASLVQTPPLLFCAPSLLHSPTELVQTCSGSIPFQYSYIQSNPFPAATAANLCKEPGVIPFQDPTGLQWSFQPKVQFTTSATLVPAEAQPGPLPAPIPVNLCKSTTASKNPVRSKLSTTRAGRPVPSPRQQTPLVQTQPQVQAALLNPWWQFAHTSPTRSRASTPGFPQLSPSEVGLGASPELPSSAPMPTTPKVNLRSEREPLQATYMVPVKESTPKIPPASVDGSLLEPLVPIKRVSTPLLLLDDPLPDDYAKPSLAPPTSLSDLEGLLFH